MLDQPHFLLVFVLDLASLQGGQPFEWHVEDRLGLGLAEFEPAAQVGVCALGGAGATDSGDHFVQVVERGEQSFQDVGALPGAGQFVLAAPPDDDLPVFQVGQQRLLERQQARLAVHQRQHDEAEGALHWGEPEDVGENLLRLDGAGQFDHQPHAPPVRFIAQVGEALDATVAHQLGDALDEAALVDLVGQFGDDDAVAGTAHLLDVGAGAHGDFAPAPPVGVGDDVLATFLLAPVNHTAGGEIRPLYEAHQVFDSDVVQFAPAVEHVDQRVAHLAQVVGRDGGGHPHGDAGGAVD